MMRAKTLNEVQNFERGSDPKASMNIGKVAKIKEMLDRIYKENGFLQYKIKSPEHIEVSYIKRVDNEGPNIWIMKYVEKERFSMESESRELSSSTHSFGNYHEWKIKELKFYSSMWPDDNKFDINGVLGLDKADGTNEEKAQIIVKAFNDHFGKVGGFELISAK